MQGFGAFFLGVGGWGWKIICLLGAGGGSRPNFVKICTMWTSELSREEVQTHSPFLDARMVHIFAIVINISQHHVGEGYYTMYDEHVYTAWTVNRGQDDVQIITWYVVLTCSNGSTGPLIQWDRYTGIIFIFLLS